MIAVQDILDDVTSDLTDAIAPITLLGFAALMIRIAINELRNGRTVAEQRESICVAKLDTTITSMTALTTAITAVVNDSPLQRASIAESREAIGRVETKLDDIKRAVTEIRDTYRRP